MRCREARKRLSDALDGAVPVRTAARLAEHLTGCPDCLAYRERLVRIQARSRLAVGPPALSWTAFEERVGARLAAAEKGSLEPRVPFAARRRWAFAAASAAVVVLAGLAALALFRQPPLVLTAAWAGYEDVLGPLVSAAETDPGLAGRLESRIDADIEELAPAGDDETAVVPAADPLFWESLSNDDLRAIVAGLEAEDAGRGGPR